MPVPFVVVSYIVVVSPPVPKADENVFTIGGSTGGDAMTEPCRALASVDLINSSAPT